MSDRPIDAPPTAPSLRVLTSIPAAERIERLAARDDMTAEQAQALIDAGNQAEDDARASRAAHAEAEHQAKRERFSRILKGVSFPKGKSGNPGGQPGPNPNKRSLAARVRSATENNQDQIEFFVMLANGELEGSTVADRIKANEWLANRGHGKSPETHVNVEADADTLEDVSSDELRELLRK